MMPFGPCFPYNFDTGNLGQIWPPPTPSDHRFDILFYPLELRLHTTVGKIANPPPKPKRQRLLVCRITIPNALHTPGNQNLCAIRHGVMSSDPM